MDSSDDHTRVIPQRVLRATAISKGRRRTPKRIDAMKLLGITIWVGLGAYFIWRIMN